MRRLLIIALLMLPLTADAQRWAQFQVAGPSGDMPFTPLHTYFMAPNGNDSCNGTTTTIGTSGNCAWLTPDHTGLVCGDVIIAQVGAYPAAGIGISNSPSGCPSSSGGIDGIGQIYFVTVVCVQAFACTLNSTAGSGNGAIDISANNWSFQGWKVTTTNKRAFCYFADGGFTSNIYHHIAFINDICVDAGLGFVSGDNGQNSNIPGNGIDQFAVVGSLTWNANQRDDFPSASIVAVAPANFNSSPGTHILFNGNFAINNSVPIGNGAVSDLEGFMFDTPEVHAYTGQTVMKNNVVYNSSWAGIQLFSQNIHSVTIDVEIAQNTIFNNGVCIPTTFNGNFNTGELNIQLDGNFPWTINISNNIIRSVQVHLGCAGTTGAPMYAILMGSTSHANPPTPTVITGGTGKENILFALQPGCPGTPANCVTLFDNYTVSGPNTYTDPLFTNTTDLLANHLTQPNCTGFSDVAACMGWNYALQTASSLSVIADLTPTCGASCTGKGYQPPKPCAVDVLYPTYLKGVVYHQVNGGFSNTATVTEKAGLVNKPCGM